MGQLAVLLALADQQAESLLEKALARGRGACRWCSGAPTSRSSS